MNDLNKKCMGEFPMFPGWLFFEEKAANGNTTIYAYGSRNRILSANAPQKDQAVANVLNQILSQYPPKG